MVVTIDESAQLREEKPCALVLRVGPEPEVDPYEFELDQLMGMVRSGRILLPQDRIHLANNALCRFSGYGMAELLGSVDGTRTPMEVHDLITRDPQDQLRHRVLQWRYVLRRDSQPMLDRPLGCTHRDGTPLVARVSVLPAGPRRTVATMEPVR